MMKEILTKYHFRGFSKLVTESLKLVGYAEIVLTPLAICLISGILLHMMITHDESAIAKDKAWIKQIITVWILFFLMNLWFAFAFEYAFLGYDEDLYDILFRW